MRRHVQVIESTSELAVVKETLNLNATGLFDAVQENQYVMDRKTMLNVADDRAWAFDAANVVDRSGDYRLNFPLDNKSHPVPDLPERDADHLRGHARQRPADAAPSKASTCTTSWPTCRTRR